MFFPIFSFIFSAEKYYIKNAVALLSYCHFKNQDARKHFFRDKKDRIFPIKDEILSAATCRKQSLTMWIPHCGQIKYRNPQKQVAILGADIVRW